MDYPLVFFGVALKSFLLLLATLVAFLLCARKSAATQHGIWTLGFISCLLVPAVSYLLPSWSLPALPNAAFAKLSLDIIPVEVNRSRTVGLEAMLPPPVAATRPQRIRLTSDPVQTSRRYRSPDQELNLQRATALPVEMEPPVNAQKQPAISWRLVATLFWATGILVCCFRALIRWLLLRAMLRTCTEVNNSSWLRSLQQVSQQLDVRFDVGLRTHDSAHSPVVAGILDPVAILPQDADDWSECHRRLVLLHELAHVKRRDILTQTVASLVCAVYWFNPLTWYGARKMRDLRELACDDLVLNCDQRPSDYANVLLDVAKSYRHQSLAPTVGMVRSRRVEERIMAVLDRARSRVALTWRKTVGLLVISALLVGLIGSAQLKSQDVEAQPSQEENKAVTPIEDINATRVMQIRVTDEQGSPLKGAQVHAAVWYVDGYEGEKTPRDSYTDKMGIENLQVPRKLKILRMWVSKIPYVEEFVNFGKGSHLEGKTIPHKFDFQLARGTEIGGQVVDEDGMPIAGVTVDVKVNARKSPPTQQPSMSAEFNYPSPGIGGWLTDTDYHDCPRPVTDEAGRWKIVTAPAAPESGEDHGFDLRLRHPAYLGDIHWGGLQRENKVTVPMLRSGTAEITMKRGIELTGVVRDEAGNPVSEGIVVWSDHPYFGGDAVFETLIEETGEFQTPPLRKGEYPLTILAPGFQPNHRVVAVSDSMESPVFKLKPGKSLQINVVNRNGKPIPNSYVTIDGWRNAKSLYNMKHSSITDSGIPNRANAEGVFKWDWAPHDAVTYNIQARDYASKSVTLIAMDEPHVVKLSKPLVATGVVTEKKSGRPISAFKAIPITEFRPLDLTTRFREAATGVSGSYELSLMQPEGDAYRYRVRVEANGYRAAISEESYGADDGTVKIDFSLERAEVREGRVVDDNGKAVSRATVVWSSPSKLTHFRNAEPQWGSEEFLTDANGRFRLGATPEPIRIRVLDEKGFAEVYRKPDESIGDVQIQPWASVSGTLVQDGKPVADQGIHFSPLIERKPGEPDFQDAYFTQTDAEGRFEFKRVQPGPGNVKAYLGPWRDSPLTSSQCVPMELEPGEHRSLILGGAGTEVTGKVLATNRGNAELNKQYSLNFLIRRDGGIETPNAYAAPSFDASGPVEASWFLDNNARSWLETRDHYFVKMTPDGLFRVVGVPPGKYDLLIQLYEQPVGCLVESIGSQVVHVDVSEQDAAKGKIDVGVIKIKCRTGPRAGESMRLYEFVDKTNRVRSIGDVKGRHVVMHVWASWCEPCISSMSKMKAKLDQWNDNRVSFIGINVDADTFSGKTLAKRNAWSWPHKYVGDDSDITRQLAISSVPTYFLISPDGLLVASANEWEPIQEQLDVLLEATPTRPNRSTRSTH